MDDLISRQAAIEALKGLPTWWADEGGYYGGAQPPMVGLLDPEDAVSAIENLPSADRPQQWIPCSERLPSEGEYVLVTENWNGYVRMWRLQYIDNEPTWEVDGYNVDIDEAVAWMPLPEPWKGADDERAKSMLL